MSLAPRAEELLAKYPDQLSDAELEELRGLAEDDFLLSTMMDSLQEAESLLRGESDQQEMSEGGRELLDSIVSETLSDNPEAGMSVSDLMAPLEAAPSAEVEEEAPTDGEPVAVMGAGASEQPSTTKSPRWGLYLGAFVSLAAAVYWFWSSSQ
jgi:hypothetical protein